MRFFQGKSCGKAAVFLLAVLVLGLSAGCGTSSKAQNEQLWGRSDAKEIDINSKIAGRVVELTVKEGDTVKKGQVIAHIDKRDLEAQRNQYAANIEAITAQQGQASATTRMQSGTTQSALGEYIVHEITRPEVRRMNFQLQGGGVRHSGGYAD